jgi:hypothetical protein
MLARAERAVSEARQTSLDLLGSLTTRSAMYMREAIDNTSDNAWYGWERVAEMAKEAAPRLDPDEEAGFRSVHSACRIAAGALRRLAYAERRIYTQMTGRRIPSGGYALDA